MVGWHHRINRHESEQAPGVGDGQGSLACCRQCGHKESYITERLNNKSSFHILPFSCQWDPLFRVIAFLEIKRYLVCLFQKGRKNSVLLKRL